MQKNANTINAIKLIGIFNRADFLMGLEIWHSMTLTMQGSEYVNT
jgi:hypothetical protein